jgi:hypothetical protein
LDGWIYWRHIHTTRDYRQYSATADPHTLQFTVTHALGFSVFTSRILATDFITVSLTLQITYKVLFAPSNSFIAIILQLPISKTRLYSIQLKLFFITTFHGPRRKHNLSISGNACLQRRCMTAEVTCVLAAGMCLQSRCLAMNVYSDFTIPAFGRHVTISIKPFLCSTACFSFNVSSWD